MIEHSARQIQFPTSANYPPFNPYRHNYSALTANLHFVDIPVNRPRPNHSAVPRFDRQRNEVGLDWSTSTRYPRILGLEIGFNIIPKGGSPQLRQTPKAKTVTERHLDDAASDIQLP